MFIHVEKGLNRENMSKRSIWGVREDGVVSAQNLYCEQHKLF